MQRSLRFLVLVLALCSCSVATRVDYENHEGTLGKDFFDEIRNNKTDTNWLMANLGEPLHSENLDVNVNVYTWQLSRADYKHASLLVVFRYNTVEKEKEYLHVVSVEGTVKKHWLDRSAQIQEYVLDDFK